MDLGDVKDDVKKKSSFPFTLYAVMQKKNKSDFEAVLAQRLLWPGFLFPLIVFYIWTFIRQKAKQDAVRWDM